MLSKSDRQQTLLSSHYAVVSRMLYALGKCLDHTLQHTFRQDLEIMWKRSFGSTRDVAEGKALLNPSRGLPGIAGDLNRIRLEARLVGHAQEMRCCLIAAGTSWLHSASSQASRSDPESWCDDGKRKRERERESGCPALFVAQNPTSSRSCRSIAGRGHGSTLTHLCLEVARALVTLMRSSGGQVRSRSGGNVMRKSQDVGGEGRQLVTEACFP